MKWWLRYDARKRWAERYGLCRVVEAETAGDAEAVVRRYEDGWEVTLDAVRPASPSQIERQEAIEHWLTMAKQGRAGRGLGL